MNKNEQSIHQDEWLADFTDQMLDGETSNPLVTGSDPEMRALTDTLLRLKNAFPKQELDPASVKRMQAKVLERWHREEEKKSRWAALFQAEWLTRSRRQQFGMAFAMIAIAGILILTAPLLFQSGDPLTASAGSEMTGTFLWIALGTMVVIAAWLLSRKS